MKNIFRHRPRTVTVLFIMALFIGVAYTLGWSSVFSVKSVIVIGAPTQSESGAIAASISVGDKLARIEPRALSATLQNFAWLRTSRASRNWINGSVTIRVLPRTPVARIAGKLIDDVGKIFTLPGTQSNNLPIIEANSTPALKFAVDLLNLLPLQVKQSLVSISASGPRSARLNVLANSAGNSRVLTILWGDLSNTDLKARVYSALLALPENERVKVIDVSAPHAPIVK